MTGDSVVAGSFTGLEITSRSGRVTVRARAIDHAEVLSGSAEILPDGTVRGRSSGRIEIACPEGTDLFIGSLSGRVDCHGPVGRVAVTSTSGRVSIEAAREIEVRSRSGGVDIGRCEGSCRVTATSGSVEIEAADSIDVTVASGRIRVGQVGDATVCGGSGSVRLGLTRVGAVQVSTLSGSVTITAPSGLRPQQTLTSRSGRADSELEDGTEGTLSVETSSGRIRVTRS